MNRFVKLTLPANGNMPARPVHFNINHIVSVAPRYVVHPEDLERHVLVQYRRYIIEGSWIEAPGGGEDALTPIVETYGDVMRAIDGIQEAGWVS